MAADPRAVLVTGGAGYIGSHTARALDRAGYRVVVFDNLVAGHRDAVKAAVLAEGDVTDAAAVRRALTEHRIAAVVHLAAFLDVGESVREPARYYRNNVGGALTVLEAMAAESVGCFVFSSSCATYGDPAETPIVEAHPQRPVNSYGETKLAVERALPHFERAYGIRSMSLRYFNAAGAHPDGDIGEDHMPEIHLIPRAIQAATGGDRLEVFGDDYPTPDGTCLRDFVHVVDLAEGHVCALEALFETGRSGAYNLGSGRAHSVKQVIARVEQVTGRPVPWACAPRRGGDPAILLAAPDKAHAELHWKPRLSDLDTIVATAWNWHRGHPHGYGGR